MTANDLDEAKSELKKLSARAMQLKMDLHDLSEELPQNWPSILDVATRTYEAFRLLDRKRSDLKALEVQSNASKVG